MREFIILKESPNVLCAPNKFCIQYLNRKISAVGPNVDLLTSLLNGPSVLSLCVQPALRIITSQSVHKHPSEEYLTVSFKMC